MKQLSNKSLSVFQPVGIELVPTHGLHYNLKWCFWLPDFWLIIVPFNPGWMEPWLSNHLLLSTDIIVTPAVPNSSMFSVSGSDNNIQKYNPNPIPTICCSNTHGARHLTCVVHLKPTPCWLLLTSLINQQLLVAGSKQTWKPGVTHFPDNFKGIKAIHSHYTD